MISRTKGEQYLRIGDLVKALPLLNQSVELADREFPCTSCQVARSHTSIAHCLVELGCADEAIGHFNEAIKIWRVCGEAVPPYFLVSTMTDLGELYLEEGQLSSAEESLTEALRIAREQSLAEWQDVYARLLAALSRTYHVTGRLELATDYAWAALELASTVHSPTDGSVATFQEDLAALLFEQEQTEAAMALQSTALDLCERAYGPYHPATTEGLERLAWMQSRHEVEADTFLHSWRDSQSQALRSIEAAYRSRFDWLRSAAETLPEFELVQSADAFRRTAGQYLDIVVTSNDTTNVNRAATLFFDGKSLLWSALADRYRQQSTDVNSAADTLSTIAPRDSNLHSPCQQRAV
ncbi:MAG: tetratricopeptide repeat protein [bacterium]|nr:tetratricopeptide repeat protein [bacterium]